MGSLSAKQVADQLRRARAAERNAAKTEPRARSARFDDVTRHITVELTNGCVFAFPAKLAQGLRGASAKQLKDVSVYGGGSALRWESLDVDLGLAALLMGIFGNRAWMAELGRIGGSVRSTPKAHAARRNGAKGGRPRSQ